jgi:hypothetical protein
VARDRAASRRYLFQYGLQFRRVDHRQWLIGASVEVGVEPTPHSAAARVDVFLSPVREFPAERRSVERLRHRDAFGGGGWKLDKVDVIGVFRHNPASLRLGVTDDARDRPPPILVLPMAIAVSSRIAVS